MIGPAGAVRVLVATKPVDFRKGAEGLAALVREPCANVGRKVIILDSTLDLHAQRKGPFPGYVALEQAPTRNRH